MHRTALHPHQLWATVRSDQYDKVSSLAYLASYNDLPLHTGQVHTSMCPNRHQRPSVRSRHGGSCYRSWMTRKQRTLHASWPLP